MSVMQNVLFSASQAESQRKNMNRHPNSSANSQVNYVFLESLLTEPVVFMVVPRTEKNNLEMFQILGIAGCLTADMDKKSEYLY